jgi:hypothetical protein
MKRMWLAVLALALAGALALLTGCGSSKSHGEEGTLTLIEPANAGLLTPIGPAKKSFVPGSGATISFPLENSGKKTVGELKAFCFATQPSSGGGLEGTCNGTVIAPGGSFALSAGSKEIFTPEAGVSGAITGGTGKYNGALGSFTSKPNGNSGTSNLTFDYILP